MLISRYLLRVKLKSGLALKSKESPFPPYLLYTMRYSCLLECYLLNRAHAVLAF